VITERDGKKREREGRNKKTRQILKQREFVVGRT
jgi:hypothetical protein